MVENSIFPYSLFNFDQILIMYKWNELVIYFLSSLLATFKHHLRLYSSQVGFPNPGYFIQTQVLGCDKAKARFRVYAYYRTHLVLWVLSVNCAELVRH